MGSVAAMPPMVSTEAVVSSSIVTVTGSMRIVVPRCHLVSTSTWVLSIWSRPGEQIAKEDHVGGVLGELAGVGGRVRGVPGAGEAGEEIRDGVGFGVRRSGHAHPPSVFRYVIRDASCRRSQ